MSEIICLSLKGIMEVDKTKGVPVKLTAFPRIQQQVQYEAGLHTVNRWGGFLLLPQVLLGVKDSSQ